MKKSIEKIRCGITGHSGTIGKEIIKSKSKSNILFYKFKGDIRIKKDVRSWIKNNDFNYLIHLAAVVPIKEVNRNKDKAYDVNVKGTRNIVDAILKTKNKIKWIFYSSTSHVYSSSKKKIKENYKTKPISYYGLTKLKGEKELQILNNYNINLCIGRIFSTANNSQRNNYLIPDLKKKIKNLNSKIILDNLNHYRDFISIKDISKIIIFFLKNKTKGTINICSGKKTKLMDIAQIIAHQYKKKIFFKINNNATYLIGNNNLLKNLFKKKISNDLKKIIFND